MYIIHIPLHNYSHLAYTDCGTLRVKEPYIVRSVEGALFEAGSIKKEQSYVGRTAITGPCEACYQ